MDFTPDQKTLISMLIGTKIAPRTRSESLRRSLMAANENMHAGALTESDLILISSALELLLPQSPVDENKEEYRELVEVYVSARRLLSSASGKAEV